jgi:hypothetical protein
VKLAAASACSVAARARTAAGGSNPYSNSVTLNGLWRPLHAPQAQRRDVLAVQIPLMAQGTTLLLGAYPDVLGEGTRTKGFTDLVGPAGANRSLAYTTLMDRRLIVGILLLALAWQGPALAYSASLTTPVGTTSGVLQCAGGGNGCDGCCSHNSGSCAATCALSLSTVVPTSILPVPVTVPRLPAPESHKPPLVEHHPARLLRPPIV